MRRLYGVLLKRRLVRLRNFLSDQPGHYDYWHCQQQAICYHVLGRSLHRVRIMSFALSWLPATVVMSFWAIEDLAVRSAMMLFQVSSSSVRMMLFSTERNLSEPEAQNIVLLWNAFVVSFLAASERTSLWRPINTTLMFWLKRLLCQELSIMTQSAAISWRGHVIVQALIYSIFRCR